MLKSHFWDDCAAAMDLTIDGNRLIAAEVSKNIGDHWRSAKHWLSEALRGIGNIRDLPPV